jgi:glucosamine--fructose-6-phosphate aminotransferase (isomerizing)
MCGIAGIVGRAPVAPLILDALRRLEYRGYDSAGIATLEDGHLTRYRATGKLVNLEARVRNEPINGTIGIGHTRWATHGAPNEANAHPHATERVAVVHNGIIENFQALREAIRKSGRQLSSDTDTEVIAHLVTMALDAGLDPERAMSETLRQLEGAFAIVVMFEGHDDLLIAARRGSPLAIGHGDREMFVGSDALALCTLADRVTYLEDGDWALVSRDRLTVFDESGRKVERPVKRLARASLAVSKGNHRYFMHKEMYEQPETISHTLSHYLDFATSQPMSTETIDFRGCANLSISGCGTAYHAGLIASYWFERLAKLPVAIDVASEFRYREMPLGPGGLALFVSQSGETADTLASLRYCARAGQKIGAIVNVPTSTIAREAHHVLPTLAGPEIGVASTKAFTCQLSVLLAMAIVAGQQRGALGMAETECLIRSASVIPGLVSRALRLETRIAKLASEMVRAPHVVYIGRGTSYPIALEGALKLKEISYVNAQGYAAGELKHGPIALIDASVPVVVIAPHDHLFEKTCSNMHEVAARGGRIVLVTDQRGAEAANIETVETLVMPDMAPEVTPIVYAIPMQLLAYHAALAAGTDVDQPRNLAKSVTVE